MSREIIPSGSNLPKSIREKIYDLLSETALKRATEYVKKYETETDALLLNRGLSAIRDMLIYIDKYYSNISNQKLELILMELGVRIKEVDKIICTIRGKRPLPILTNDDKKMITEIEEVLKNISHTRNGISLKNVIPFMIESKNK